MARYELFRKGESLYLAGRFDKAEKPLYDFLLENPRHELAREYLMTIYAKQRKKAKAMRVATRAADLSSGDPSGLASIASQIRDIGDVDKSIRILEDSLKECKRQSGDKYSEAYIRGELARSYEERGNNSKARDERAIAENLNNPQRYDYDL